jgi:carbon storage regulator
LEEKLTKVKNATTPRRKLWETKGRRIKVRGKHKNLRRTNQRSTKKDKDSKK